MYKKKELLFLFIAILICILGYYLFNKDNNSNVIITEESTTIVITIDGEVIRKTKMEFQNEITYGSLFIKVKNLLNEYSDLSGFDYYEVISESTDIYIPTIDIGNNYVNPTLININTATKEELISLPQIGEKRSQAILDYIKRNGKITSWDVFFQIVTINEEYKESIKQQAIL